MALRYGLLLGLCVGWLPLGVVADAVRPALVPAGEQLASGEGALDSLARRLNTRLGTVHHAAFSPQGDRIVTASSDNTARLWNADNGELIVVLEGHTDWVNHAAFSPQGDRIVTASDDNTARLWNADNGELIAVLEGHTGRVYHAAFSPQGDRIVTASGDDTARLWNADDGELIDVLKGHTDWVNHAAFSPQGDRIVTASDDNTARLWNADNGELIAVLEGHTGRVYHAAFSPQGDRIVTASGDDTARLWNADDGELIDVLKGHTDWVNHAAFSPQGDRIVTASDDNTARLWNADNGELIAVLEGHTGRVYHAAFSPQGDRIVTASGDDTARLWNADDGELIDVLKGHTDWVNHAAFSPQGDRIVTASDDNTARLWNADNGELIAVLEGHTGRVYHAAFSPQGDRIVTASRDNTARLWNAGDGELIAVLEGHTGRVYHAAFSPQGDRIVTASRDNTARLWNADNGELIVVLEGHTSWVYHAAFSPQGDRIVTASRDNTARLWNADNGELIVVLEGHRNRFYHAAFSPQGDRIVTVSGDDTARLWNADDGELIDVLKGHTDWVNHAAFSPQGDRIVTASGDNTARLWNADNGELIVVLEGHRNRVSHAAFSPQGDRIVTASGDDTARLWNADNGELIAVLEGHRNRVSHAAFSPQGDRIVTASRGKTVRLWSADDGELIAVFEGHTDRVTHAAFSPQGNRIVTASFDGSIRLWDTDTAKPLRLMVATSNGQWLNCQANGHCLRHDDGTLFWPPLPPQATGGKLSLENLPEATIDTCMSLPCEPRDFVVGIRNTGTAPLYWLQVVSAESGPVSLSLPPPPLPPLHPDDHVELSIRLASVAPTQQPQRQNTSIKLAIRHAHGELPIDLPVTVRTPEITLLEASLTENRETIAVQVSNHGGVSLSQAVAEAAINGQAIPGSLNLPVLPGNMSKPQQLAFTAPADFNYPDDTEFTLQLRNANYPHYQWTLKHPLTLPWQLYTLLAALILVLGGLAWFVGVRWHPLVRLAVNQGPTALALPQLGQARRWLQRARLWRDTVQAQGLAARWQSAEAFLACPDPVQQIEQLAGRLQAEVLPANEATPTWLATLRLNEGFILRLPQCTVALPGADHSIDQITTQLRRCEGVCLLITTDPDQQAALRADRQATWVIPDNQALVRLWLAAADKVNDQLASIIAEQVDTRSLSPWRTGHGMEDMTMFFGRDQLLRDILERPPRNYLLVGARQLGKTSLLQKLQHLCDQRDTLRGFKISLGSGHFAIDLQRIAGQLALARNASLPDILTALAHPPAGIHHWLLVDEADELAGNHTPENAAVLDQMRNLSAEGRCHFILAGFWGLYREAILEYQSKLKNFGDLLLLDALEDKASRALLTRPMHALQIHYQDDTLVTRILHETGGRTNLLAIVADDLVRRLGNQRRVITDEDISEVLNDAVFQDRLLDWKTLSGNILDQILVYASIDLNPLEQGFTEAELWQRLDELGDEVSDDAVQNSLIRLRLGFIIKRVGGRYYYRVPVQVQQILDSEPERALRRLLNSLVGDISKQC